VSHEHLPDSDVSFEDFNKMIDEAEDSVCGFCFSFGHYKHYSPLLRKIAWLGWTEKEEERQLAVLSELERIRNQPYSQELYSLIIQCELVKPVNGAVAGRFANVLYELSWRAITEQWANAWVTIRAYAWLPNRDNDKLLVMGLASNDISTKQVILQQSYNRNLPYMENQEDAKLLKEKLYRITCQCLDRQDEGIEVESAAHAGILAMMSYQDPRVLECIDREKRKILTKITRDGIDKLIKHLTDRNDLSFVPTLEKIKNDYH